MLPSKGIGVGSWVKRMRQEISDILSEDLISFGSSLMMKRNLEYTQSDMDDLLSTVDSHRSSVLSSLRRRLIMLGLESGTESNKTESSESSNYSEEENDGNRINPERVARFADDVRLVDMDESDERIPAEE